MNKTLETVRDVLQKFYDNAARAVESSAKESRTSRAYAQGTLHAVMTLGRELGLAPFDEGPRAAKTISIERE